MPSAFNLHDTHDNAVPFITLVNGVQDASKERSKPPTSPRKVARVRYAWFTSTGGMLAKFRRFLWHIILKQEP